MAVVASQAGHGHEAMILYGHRRRGAWDMALTGGGCKVVERSPVEVRGGRIELQKRGKKAMSS
jgi:hypothetical protein